MTDLDKELSRATKHVLDDKGKKLIITLTPNDEIKFYKSGKWRNPICEIGIVDLFTKLSTDKEAEDIEAKEKPKKIRKPNEGEWINLKDFRSLYLTASRDDIPLDIKIVLENITCQLLDNK